MILAAAVPHELLQAVSFTVGTTWEVLRALVLGFLLPAVGQGCR